MDDRTPIKSTPFMFELINQILETDGAGVSELSDEFDIPTSTVHDHLRTLDSLGYLTSKAGTYRVSTRFLEIGKQVQHNIDVYRESRYELENLADDTGEFTALMIKEDDLGVIMSMMRGEKAVEMNIARIFPGTRTQLHTTALGKAILSTLTNKHVREVVSQYGLSSKTDRTITNKGEIFDEIETIREQGYALDDQERFEGMRGVGVHIDSAEEYPAAIGLYGPANRLTGSYFREEIPQRVLEVANVVQVNLDYS